MKRTQQQIGQYLLKYNDKQQYGQNSQQDPDWEFQKIQLVYQVKKDALKNTYQNPCKYEKQQSFKNYVHKKANRLDNKLQIQNLQNPFNFNKMLNNYNSYQQESQYNPYQKSYPYSKSNTDTNVVSDNQSMQYLSSQQPSFSNKESFTVVEDFNLEALSPVKKSFKHVRNQNQKNNRHITNFGSSNRARINLKQKYILIYEQIQEVKFMKQSFQSKLKQQKVYFTNDLQQIKKIFFKLNLKYQKQMIEFSKSRTVLSKNPLYNSSDSNQLQVFKLRQYCRNLEEQKIKSQQRYQKSLKTYQQEIQIISQQLEKRIQNKEIKQYYQSECQNCRQSQQSDNFLTYQIQILKNRLKQQQQKHSQSMKSLQQKVFALQYQFQCLQKAKNQNQKRFKCKQKQLVYRQSQVQYRLRDVQRREKQLQMCESVIRKQKSELQLKKQKIADYELRIMKEERKCKVDIKQKQIMASQYFNDNQKRGILSKNHFIPMPQRSESKSSRSSKIDISSRIKQIQTMRSGRTNNYEQNGSSSSKESKFTGKLNSPRNTTTFRAPSSYAQPSQNIYVKKQYRPQGNQIIKLNQKLSSLTQTLQKQLRQIH